LKLASLKLDTSHLSRDEEALSRCEIALEQKDKANLEGALEIMRPLWRQVGTRPNTDGLQPETAADVFLCTGILTGWIGSRSQIKNAQEAARNLITESIVITRHTTSLGRPPKHGQRLLIAIGEKAK
jgi:hypothetical protein